MSAYRLTSDEEPSEEELAQIMHEVAVEAKQRADAARARLDKLIAAQIIEAQNRFKMGNREA